MLYELFKLRSEGKKLSQLSFAEIIQEWIFQLR